MPSFSSSSSWMMMRGVTGDFIRSMPATVVYTLSASLFLSLTLTPYLASRFIRVTAGSGYSRLRGLLQHFIEKFNRLRDKAVTGVSPRVMDLLMRHDYPENIREL
mgnify:CR=1 FL=1